MKDMGVASSTTTLFRTLGSSLGVAVMGAIFNDQVRDEMSARAGSLGGQITEKSAQLDAASLAKLPAVAREAYRHAVSAGTHAAFLLGAAVAVVTLVAALVVKETPLRGLGPVATEPGASAAPGTAAAQDGGAGGALDPAGNADGDSAGDTGTTVAETV
jgi:hypothetical protein